MTQTPPKNLPPDSDNSHASLNALAALIQTVHHLRAPGGCPWDSAQTHQSLRPYLIEEAYEVLDVIDQITSPEDLKKEKIRSAFKEELGDLLMQVLLHSEMAQEAGAFNFNDVAQGLNDKLIRRHPHVFRVSENPQAGSADKALQSWEKEKAKEKAHQKEASILDGLPRNLPSLQKAARILEKVTQVGFQWKDLEGPFQKIEEELDELKVEVDALDQLNQQKNDSFEWKQKKDQASNKVEAELGDLLFTLCNVAYLLKVAPENALRRTVTKFENRFRFVERRLKDEGKTPEQSNLKEMDAYWDEAKEWEHIQTGCQIWGLTGGIASGKSTVGTFFQEMGIPVVDADEIARGLLKEGNPAAKAVHERFGTLDRTRLKDLVFSEFADPKAKKDLEALLHPHIQKESRKRIAALAKTHPIVLYEAILLIETGRYRELSGLIVVEAPKEERLQRILSRGGTSLEIAERILASQSSDSERRRFADLCIENGGSLSELKEKVKLLIAKQNWLQK